MKALSLAHTAPNESCARRIDALAMCSWERVLAGIVDAPRRSKGRLSHSARTGRLREEGVWIVVAGEGWPLG
jgi:hypothetical protein